MNSKPTKKNIMIRGINIVTALAPHMIGGLTVSELSRKTGYSMAAICRDLDTLMEAGWVGREDGRYILTSRPIALSHACDLAFRNARERQEDFSHNVKAGALRILEQ